jgi:hypothetical protein
MDGSYGKMTAGQPKGRAFSGVGERSRGSTRLCGVEGESGTQLSREELIIVEDPVEYTIGDINGINPKAGLTFACGLRSTLRADPYVCGDGRRDKRSPGRKRKRRGGADRREESSAVADGPAPVRR